MPLIDAAGYIAGTHRETVALTAFFDKVGHINQSTIYQLLQINQMSHQQIHQVLKDRK